MGSSARREIFPPPTIDVETRPIDPPPHSRVDQSRMIISLYYNIDNNMYIIHDDARARIIIRNLCVIVASLVVVVADFRFVAPPHLSNGQSGRVPHNTTPPLIIMSSSVAIAAAP